ncbi:hypothetical protein DSECCO2_238660 [anaerobic digester metagenome]
MGGNGDLGGAVGIVDLGEGVPGEGVVKRGREGLTTYDDHLAAGHGFLYFLHFQVLQEPGGCGTKCIGPSFLEEFHQFQGIHSLFLTGKNHWHSIGEGGQHFP